MFNRKRIVLFGSQITVGGAQRVLLDQAEWFTAQGADVHAVFFYDKDGLLNTWRARNNFPITALSDFQRGGGVLKNLTGVLKGFLRLVKHLKRERPDVLECFTHDANLLGLIAGFLAGVPRRFGTHHGQFVGLSPLKTALHTLVINSPITHGLVCVSERAKNQALAEGIRPEKIRVIFNGVRPVSKSADLRDSVRAELGIAPNERMILNVGRLVPEKSQSTLIRAAAIALRQRQDLRFFIAGSGPLERELTAEINALGIADRFTLLGNRDDIPRLLNGADGFILCSRTEGMPVSLMEAMSAGLPSVCSDLEGIVQLMGEDDHCGKIIPHGDATLLANALLTVLSDPTRAEQMGQNARARMDEQFSPAASNIAYGKLFFDTP